MWIMSGWAEKKHIEQIIIIIKSMIAFFFYFWVENYWESKRTCLYYIYEYT